MERKARSKRKPPKAEVSRSLEKIEILPEELSVPRKPRVGEDFQAALPDPVPAAPNPAASQD